MNFNVCIGLMAIFFSAYLREYLHYSRILQALIALPLRCTCKMFILERNDYLFNMAARWKTYSVYEFHGMSRVKELN